MSETTRRRTAKTHLSLPGETVDLLEACPGDPTLEDAEVLFGVDIERLLVDGLVSFLLLGEDVLGIPVEEAGEERVLLVKI